MVSGSFEFPQDAYSNQILNNSLGKEKVWVRIPLGDAESSDGVTVALKKEASSNYIESCGPRSLTPGGQLMKDS